MAKAILLIDLEDELNLDDLEIRYVIQDKYGNPIKAIVDGEKLKPMPQKNFNCNIYKYKEDGTIYSEPKDYAMGWNDCIDEILGDTEC